MRIAIAGLALESVSFLDKETGIEDFEREAFRGSELIEKLRSTETVAAGFIRVCEEEHVDIEPVVYTNCFAGGPASNAAFEKYSGEITETLAARRGDIDGVLLFLHGAMTTPALLNPEQELLKRIRKVLGPDIPVMVALDLHANIDRETLNPATAVFGFHFSPHTDMPQTGERAARCLIATLRAEVSPRVAIAKPAVVLPSIFTATALPPLSEIVDEGFRLEREHPNVLDISVFCGFAYADVPQIGFSVVVVTDDDMELAENLAGRLAETIQTHRHALLHREMVFPAGEGTARAIRLAAEIGGPVVLLEHADRMNDSTWGLRELIAQGARNVAVPYLWDPEAIKQVSEEAVGKTITLSFGGKSSGRAGGEVTLTGKVLFAGTKSYTGTGPMRKGNLIHLGHTVLMEARDITLSIVSHPEAAIDEDPFIQFGLNVSDFGVILLRSKTHFRAVFEVLVREIIIIETPDYGPADLSTLPYRNVRPGVFPINEAH